MKKKILFIKIIARQRISYKYTVIKMIEIIAAEKKFVKQINEENPTTLRAIILFL